MSEKTTVYIEKFGNGKTPVYSSKTAAGCDVFAAENMTIRPGEIKLLPLNIKFALEEGVEAQVRPRSGLSLKTSLRLPNSPGTIDSDYRNEICAILENAYTKENFVSFIKENKVETAEIMENYREVTVLEYLGDDFSGGCVNLFQTLREPILVDKNNNPFGTIYINKGDRIAQIIFARHLTAEFIEAQDVAAIGNDRGGGFGSTGV